MKSRKTVIKLERKQFSNHVIITYMDGNSDRLIHSKALIKLKSLGVSDPEKVCDHLWNFGKANVVLDR